jgi:hypothetical protein
MSLAPGTRFSVYDIVAPVGTGGVWVIYGARRDFARRRQDDGRYERGVPTFASRHSHPWIFRRTAHADL